MHVGNLLSSMLGEIPSVGEATINTTNLLSSFNSIFI